MNAPTLVPLKRLVDPRRPITYGIVQAGEDDPNGVPYIRPVDMVDFARDLDPAGLRRTTRAIAEQYARSTVQTGDLIVSIGPSFGKTLIVPASLNGANLTQGTARVAPAVGVDVRYLQWALSSPLARSFWEAAVGGATFGGLNLGPFSRTPIPLHEPSAQRAIADFLDRETSRGANMLNTVAAIEARLSEARQAAFDETVWTGTELTVALRWAGFRCVTGPFGTVLSADEYIDDGVPLINPTHIRDGRVVPSSRESVSAETARRLDRYRLRKGDLVVGRKGDLGRSALVGAHENGWLCGSDSIALRPNLDRFDERFVVALMHTSRIRHALLARSSGATVANMNERSLLACQAPLISRAEQLRRVVQLEEELARLDRLQDTARRLRERSNEYRVALVSEATLGVEAVEHPAKTDLLTIRQELQQVAG